jgi:hypothetical protein
VPSPRTTIARGLRAPRLHQPNHDGHRPPLQFQKRVKDNPPALLLFRVHQIFRGGVDLGLEALHRGLHLFQPEL